MQTPPPTQAVETPRPKPTLRESLRGLDLDILQELEAFRTWQHQYASPPTPLIEDLEEELPAERLHWLPQTLLLFSIWLASCAGLILGIWWLFTPGSPTTSRRLPPPPLVRVELADLPLLPPVELETLPIIPWIDLATLPLIPEVDIDRLLAQALATPTPVPTPPPTPTPVATPRPTSAAPQIAFRTPVPPDQLNLPPNLTEGTFIVVVTYEDESSLARVRQQSPDAFVKTIAGQRYVQVASFRQAEYARFLAEELRQQGFDALVSRS
ncbi:MAG: SPOR domain-containing protein [Thermostichales cyanobacterium GMQP_bins_62]